MIPDHYKKARPRLPQIELATVQEEPIVQAEPKETTPQLVGRIVRELVLEEVDSFVQRANIVVDVADHIKQQ